MASWLDDLGLNELEHTRMAQVPSPRSSTQSTRRRISSASWLRSTSTHLGRPYALSVLLGRCRLASPLLRCGLCYNAQPHSALVREAYLLTLELAPMTTLVLF